MGDTKEKCQALCDALPECNLAEFKPGRYRKFYKCIPKSNFNGYCQMHSTSLQYYIKSNSGK